MKVRKIKIGDVCEVTGYTRDQLNGMLRELPQFIAPGARSGRSFTRNELIVICVITQMETRYATRRKAIAPLVDDLLSVLQGPRLVNRAARLCITFQPHAVSYISESPADIEGILIPLGPIFDRVDHYLVGDPLDDGQTELALGPVVLHGKKSG